MKQRFVHCTYRREPIPMGKSRTRCPVCGATVQQRRPTDGHYVEVRQVEG